jgi:H+/Cl- antiporter ClcA
LVVVGYRLILSLLKAERIQIYEILRTGAWWYTPLFFAGLVVVAAGVGWTAQISSMVGGSGIPQVKGVLLRQLRIVWFRDLVLKFLGGAGALACGLSLGR